MSGVEDLADHHADAGTRAVWKVVELPSGITAEVLHEPLVWDGERLPLRRAPLWMEHTYDVLVEELGLDPGASPSSSRTRSCGRRRAAGQAPGGVGEGVPGVVGEGPGELTGRSGLGRAGGSVRPTG